MGAMDHGEWGKDARGGGGGIDIVGSWVRQRPDRGEGRDDDYAMTMVSSKRLG